MEETSIESKIKYVLENSQKSLSKEEIIASMN